MKSAIRSARAEADIRSAFDFYISEAAHAAASFIDELEYATRHIELNPATGSPRYAHELNIPRLRFWPLKVFGTEWIRTAPVKLKKPNEKPQP